MKTMKLFVCMALVAMMFAGCTVDGMPKFENPAPTVEAVETTVEPENHTTPTESQTMEPEPAEPEPQPFTTGQQVFCVYQHEGGTGLRRFFVVSVEGDFVAVTTAIPGSGEDGDLMMFPVGDCYAESADAWAAAGMEPME